MCERMGNLVKVFLVAVGVMLLQTCHANTGLIAVDGTSVSGSGISAVRLGSPFCAAGSDDFRF